MVRLAEPKVRLVCKTFDKISRVVDRLAVESKPIQDTEQASFSCYTESHSRYAKHILLEVVDLQLSLTCAVFIFEFFMKSLYHFCVCYFGLFCD